MVQAKRLLMGIAALACVALAGMARAELIAFTANLSGAAESPVNASPGTGSATVTIDTLSQTMAIEAVFGNLQGTTTAAHIHCCTATPGAGTGGVATQTPSFIGFPLGVSAGNFANLYDLTLASTYRAGFITANGGTPLSASAALLAGLQSGSSYFNIHTTAFPGGEIRGFLTLAASPVPTPSTLVLALFALAGLVNARRNALH